MKWVETSQDGMSGNFWRWKEEVNLVSIFSRWNENKNFFRWTEWEFLKMKSLGIFPDEISGNFSRWTDCKFSQDEIGNLQGEISNDFSR